MIWLDSITDSMDMNLSKLWDSGFPDSSAGKDSACNAGDPGLIPGSGRSAGEGIGYTLQPRAAFPSACLAAQTKRWAEGIRVFSNESTLRMRWPKYWSFSFRIIPSKEHPGLISFRMDWLDLLATPLGILQARILEWVAFPFSRGSS